VRLAFEKNEEVADCTGFALIASGIREGREAVDTGVGLPLPGMLDFGVDIAPAANLSPKLWNNFGKEFSVGVEGSSAELVVEVEAVKLGTVC
jgi:hypothetical protein